MIRAANLGPAGPRCVVRYNGRAGSATALSQALRFAEGRCKASPQRNRRFDPRLKGVGIASGFRPALSEPPETEATQRPEERPSRTGGVGAMIGRSSSTIACHAVALASAAPETPDANGEQWVHLLPAGTVTGRDGRGPYHLADAAAVIEATRRRAGKTQLAVDYDHAIDRAAQLGMPAVAAGWIKGLQARADGIWGLVSWTKRAAAHLAAKEYRYLSPVFSHCRNGTIAALLRAGLTNTPNLDLTALASAEGVTMNDTNFSAELRKLLGLTPGADDAAVLAKVQEVFSATTQQSSRPDPAAPDPAKYVPLGEFERVVAELNRVHQGVTAQAAEIAVNAEITGGRLPPALKDWGVALCTVNKPAFDAFVKCTGRMFADLGRVCLPGVPPGVGQGTGGGLSDDQRAICTAMGIDPADYAKTLGA
ncbi:MAG: hypothetical protein GC191_20635 [Azospirillum sp.]|nr:hypothetical protein [Azospirillum sp.]